MTRLEADIVAAIQNSKKYAGQVNMTQKIRTAENYVYTIAEYHYTLEGMTDVEFLNAIMSGAADILESTNRRLEEDKFLWSQYEGRLIRAESVKDVWLEFDGFSRTEPFSKELTWKTQETSNGINVYANN